MEKLARMSVREEKGEVQRENGTGEANRVRQSEMEDSGMEENINGVSNVDIEPNVMQVVGVRGKIAEDGELVPVCTVDKVDKVEGLRVFQESQYLESEDGRMINGVMKENDHPLMKQSGGKQWKRMVEDKKGVKTWEQVEVKLEQHMFEPQIFSQYMSIDSCSKCFNDYLSSISMERLPHSKPLWEVHVVKSPINTIVFKFHHSLGDGYTLMGVLLSCLQRADDPSLPLSFPSLKSSSSSSSKQSFIRRFPSFISSFFISITDFGWSLMKSNWIEDDQTPIRNGHEGVEFRPSTISHMMFPMDRIKEIKSKLQVSVNDVITGTIFYGIRLYMEDIETKSSTKNCTLLAMLSQRKVKGYQKARDMQNKSNNWGNQITYLHISMPKLKDTHISNPLHFVSKAHKSITRKKRSFATSLIVGKHIHRTVKNSSLLMSNIVGPVDQMALANHPIKAFYFTLSGLPQSIVVTIMSYMGMLRVSSRTEEGFIDEQKLESCVNNAFEIIHKAALEIPTKTKF
ncbi:O-acyltransferase WSD1-like [Senna tora]|uniref:O-acyltransferase WSD1-like n=1 Tax=Senna tora TaxID=362788 RepID=A0A834TL05_9FABA|nr:O-acyltransferase WSD1-like [Senna tora]